MRKFLKNQRGQSLIELSVAVGLTSMALLAIVSLVLVGIMTQKRSANYYTAVNLAREAIEIARNTRDSNWLKIEAEQGAPTTNWDDNLYQFDIYSAVLHFDSGNFFPETQSRFLFKFIDTRGMNEATLAQIKTIYKKTLSNPLVSIYTNSIENFCSGCEATSFKRLVYLKPICDGTGPNVPASLDKCERDASSRHFYCDNGGLCTSDAPKIGIRAIVEVNWQEAGRNSGLKLVDDIYNWR
jgi:type II secretory pathway pseudopilin PulG